MGRLVCFVLVCGCLLGNGCAAGGARRGGLADAGAAIARGDQRAAAEIFADIAERDPDSPEGAVSIDMLRELSGKRLLPSPRYDCSAEANARYEEAENLHAKGEHETALRTFQTAIELCPDNATWWIYAGDAYFARGEYERAKDLYLQGLRLEPWNRAGHRYLADSEAHRGNFDAAYRQSVLAVISDPTYEAGWLFLRAFTNKLGGQFHRVRPLKPWVDPNGNVVLPRDAGGDFGWIFYASLDKAIRDGGEFPVDPPVGAAFDPSSWAKMSPLERERLKVDLTCGSIPAGKASPFWELMKASRDAGYFDEAIFVHLLHETLQADYLVYREQHTQRLVEYVTKIVAPIPPPQSHSL